MGCDIHVHCEFRNKTTDMQWFNCDWYHRNPWYKQFDITGEDDDEPKWSLIPAYDGRNYVLFGILAGVRNRDNPTISEPRGVPDDIHKQTKKEYIREKDWSHSHSWLTLQELIDYKDKYDHVKLSGMVSPEDAHELDALGIAPTEWCKSTSNESWVYREWQSDNGYYVGGLLDCLYSRFDEVFNVYNFFSESEKDKQRREYAKNARIVFWFDS